MKAALLYEPEGIRIAEVPDPVLKAGEVLVELKSCGVCATDVKKFTGKSKSPFLPFILGHEPAGIVRALGGNSASGLKEGERVAIAPVITCGCCPNCMSGRTALEGMGMCDHYEVIGFSMNGAFCEYVAAPAANIFKLPDALSFRDAAIIEPVAACANGVLRSLCTPPGTAVVLGGGFMGLVCMQIYKALGYSVLISDMLDDRLELAKILGADEAVNPQKTDVEKAVREFTQGQGADSLICAIGIQELSESGIRMMRKGGKIVMLASAGSDTAVAFNLNQLHYNQTVITGSVSYTSATYEWAIRLLSLGKIGVDHLISATGNLDEVGSLLAMTRDHVGIKNVALY
ncbi:MAG: alcohol dehydrogenase catalytic domain-containing protein [Anaerolineae bacterium]|nr:alcohol dehydrogenase catalytic domain-containing protein [Anaerolineae bacterium]